MTLDLCNDHRNTSFCIFLAMCIISLTGILSYQDMFTIIVRFLDYPHNGKNATAWHYFQKIRKNW